MFRRQDHCAQVFTAIYTANPKKHVIYSKIIDIKYLDRKGR